MQYVNGAGVVTSLLKAQPGTAKLETRSCVPKKSIAEHTTGVPTSTITGIKKGPIEGGRRKRRKRRKDLLQIDLSCRAHRGNMNTRKNWGKRKTKHAGPWLLGHPVWPAWRERGEGTDGEEKKKEQKQGPSVRLLVRALRDSRSYRM